MNNGSSSSNLAASSALQKAKNFVAAQQQPIMYEPGEIIVNSTLGNSTAGKNMLQAASLNRKMNNSNMGNLQA